MKKLLSIALVVVLLAGMAVTGTMAYLQDTDSDVNVMTLGNVKIKQHEYERVVNADGTFATDTIDNQTSYVLKDFTQGKPLYPATEVDANGNPYNYGAGDWDATFVRMTQVKSYGGMQVFTSKNAQDKFVTVENTGRSDAYVRTLIAFEIGSLPETEFDNVIGTSSFMTDQGVWKVTDIGTVEIDGNKYFVSEYLYNGAKDLGGVHENGVLPAGDTTYPSLAQVYMKATATNDDVEKIDGNKNGMYDILVLSQAVQTSGFENAQTALDTAFGKASEKAAEWFKGEEFKAPTAVATADELTAALANGESVYLTDDVALNQDTSIVIGKGNEATLNLNGHTLSEVNTRTATHNFMIDVNGGTLNISNGTVSMKHTGANMEWNGATTVIDVTNGGVLNLDGVTVKNEGGTDMNFGVHLNNWGEVTLNANNCMFDAPYCGVRVFNSGYDMNNVTIKNSTLKGATRAFWVHNYIGDLNSAQHSDEAIKARLNLDIFGNNNKFEITGTATSPIRYGFGTTVYIDLNGNVVE